MRTIFFYLIFLFSFTMFGQDYVKNVKGNVVLKGNFGENAKAKSGTLYLYELLGQGEYLLDSAIVHKSGKFNFLSREFMTGVYRLSFNNATNNVDIVINPSESNELNITFNNYRIKKGYNVNNSIENKIKKLYTQKEESTNLKIKSIRKTQQPREVKLQEMRALQLELFQYGLNCFQDDAVTASEHNSRL